jgi:hypothetical protein
MAGIGIAKRVLLGGTLLYHSALENGVFYCPTFSQHVEIVHSVNSSPGHHFSRQSIGFAPAFNSVLEP